MSELLSFILAQEDFRKARLPSLYSDFTPLHTVNPDGYTANITAWKSVLSKAGFAGLIPSSSSSSKDHLILSITPLLLTSLTTREFGTPTALGCVINDGISAEEFIPLKTFLTREGSIYYKPWVDPWKVLSWGLKQVGVGSSGVSNKLVNGEVVVVKNVEEVAKKVVKSVGKDARVVDRIMTLEMLEHAVGRVVGEEKGLSDRDMKVLVKYLERDLGEARVKGKTIKFKAPDAPLEAVTESDITTAQLKHLILTQNIKVDALSARIIELQTKAKQAVSVGNKITALSALKSKKMTEEQLQTVTNSVSTLESVLMKIEQATDNMALIDTLEQGSKVLAGLNKVTGGIERVDKVMDELNEQMAETDEMTRIIAEPGTTKFDEVEDDVQEEFELLLKGEKEKEAKAEEAKQREAQKEAEEKEAQLLADRLAGLEVADKPLRSTEDETADRDNGQQREALPA